MMANKDDIKIFRQGVKAWNEYRRVNMNARPDFSGHDFKGADLSYVNWMVTDLSGANLSGCNLKQAYMTHANLQNADLTNASIHRADMRNTNCVDTDFTGSDIFEGLYPRAVLHQTKFVGCNLRDSVWINAFMNEVDFTDADLTGADFSGSKRNGLILDGAIGFKLK
jgi:uncharacterized protein YjbI with pentapeptide repeats